MRTYCFTGVGRSLHFDAVLFLSHGSIYYWKYEVQAFFLTLKKLKEVKHDV